MFFRHVIHCHNPSMLFDRQRTVLKQVFGDTDPTQDKLFLFEIWQIFLIAAREE